MKIQVHTDTSRLIVGYRDADNDCIWVKDRNKDDGTIWFTASGLAQTVDMLFSAFAAEPDTYFPIYQGDTVTIEF